MTEQLPPTPPTQPTQTLRTKINLNAAPANAADATYARSGTGDRASAHLREPDEEPPTEEESIRQVLKDPPHWLRDTYLRGYREGRWDAGLVSAGVAAALEAGQPTRAGRGLGPVSKGCWQSLGSVEMTVGPRQDNDPLSRLLTVSVPRSREGDLTIAVRYSYKDRPATPKQQVAMTRKMLRETLARLEEGRPADLGFTEDAVRHVRTNRMEA